MKKGFNFGEGWFSSCSNLTTIFRKELEEEKMARTRLEQEVWLSNNFLIDKCFNFASSPSTPLTFDLNQVRSLKKLASKWQSVRPACGIIKKNLSMKEKHSWQLSFLAVLPFLSHFCLKEVSSPLVISPFSKREKAQLIIPAVYHISAILWFSYDAASSPDIT